MAEESQQIEFCLLDQNEANDGDHLLFMNDDCIRETISWLDHNDVALLAQTNKVVFDWSSLMVPEIAIALRKWCCLEASMWKTGLPSCARKAVVPVLCPLASRIAADWDIETRRSNQQGLKMLDLYLHLCRDIDHNPLDHNLAEKQKLQLLVDLRSTRSLLRVDACYNCHCRMSYLQRQKHCQTVSTGNDVVWCPYDVPDSLRWLIELDHHSPSMCFLFFVSLATQISHTRSHLSVCIWHFQAVFSPIYLILIAALIFLLIAVGKAITEKREKGFIAAWSCISLMATSLIVFFIVLGMRIDGVVDGSYWLIFIPMWWGSLSSMSKVDFKSGCFVWQALPCMEWVPITSDKIEKWCFGLWMWRPSLSSWLSFAWCWSFASMASSSTGGWSSCLSLLESWQTMSPSSWPSSMLYKILQLSRWK